MKRRVEIELNALGSGSLKVDGVELAAAVSGFELSCRPLDVPELKLRVLAADGLKISAEAQVLLAEIAKEQS